MFKKLYALLKGLGEVWGSLATLGVAATIITFAKSLPAWAMFTLGGVALAVCCGAMTSLYYRRRVVPRLQDGNRRLAQGLKIAVQQRDELDALLCGEAWPADHAVKVSLELLDLDHSVVLKGGPEAARAEVDFYVQALIAGPFPVVLRHYTVDITVSGPGVNASHRYEKPTGWAAINPRGTADFHVKTSFDANVGVAALQQHAVINAKGYVVVGSDDWKTDQTVHFRLSRRCLVRNELRQEANSTDSVFAGSDSPRGYG